MNRILFFVVVGVLGTAVLCGLGVWQVQRLGEKQAQLAQINDRITADPVALPESPDVARDKYLPVDAEGTIEDGQILVYASMKSIGPGYRIIAPFRVQDRLIMIDRGFLPVSFGDTALSTGAFDVRGNLHWPDEVDRFTPDPDLANSTWFARDVASMADRLGTEPVLFVAATVTDPRIVPLPVDTAGIPNNHLQYAITWFSLAIIWFAMTIYFLRRGRSPVGPKA